MRTFIKGTRRLSEGRRALSTGLGVRQIRRNPENSSYVPEETDILVNWGQTGETYDYKPTWINDPRAVRVATSKVGTYDVLRENEVPTCMYTTAAETAYRWIEQGAKVLHRALDRGSQGRGITRVENSWDTTYVGGFYVQQFGDDDNVEYRVHVMDGEVIDTAQKRRRSRNNGYEGRFDSTIRSANNGWVFCREGVECAAGVNEAAIKAVEALGLDFGAVDIATNTAGGICVYEVNTAPGLEGTTLERYVDGLSLAIERRTDRAARGA
jgi:glutathione synthase/RimK-type ligase-like ATP-grasp enzyme